MRVIEEQPKVSVMEGPWSAQEVIQDVVATGQQEDPFYVMDVGQVVQRYNAWIEAMPRVKPFYAVKCNDDKVIVSVLAALGAGFDCASKAEIELVTKLGVKPERIIFANPAKMASHIRHAAAAGVTVMTFDSETELMKIQQLMPQAELVIRIRCDAKSAQCPLGIKFGCEPETEAPRLLKIAAVLNLNVIGVSFHIGSGAHDFEVYNRAIGHAAALFQKWGALSNRQMRLLDIGGGFPGGRADTLQEVAGIVNASLDAYFPRGGVDVIAEPGRYFAAAAYTLAANVYAKREITSCQPSNNRDAHTMYFMNDGVYSSFNCVLYDHQVVTPELVQPSNEKPVECSLWGPTCDGLDCVVPMCCLPPLALGRDGAWLMFRDMGAYTLPVASPFNGFPVPAVKYYVDAKMWLYLKEQWPITELHFIMEDYASPLSPQRETPPPSPPPMPKAPLEVTPVFVECALK